MRRAALRAVAAYSANVPIERGKGVLQRTMMKLLGISSVGVTLPEGMRFDLEFPADTGYEQILFLGRYQSSTTNLMKRFVRAGDVMVDAGANMGWFTVLATSVLRVCRCHAFEPQPAIFEKLRANCRLNGILSRVELNRAALGDTRGDVQLHTFHGRPHGHASMRTTGNETYDVSHVPCTTLDDYVERREIESLDVVKVDVEGAGLGLLRGARRLLARNDPPAWIVEMDDESSRLFGHRAEEQLRFLRDHGDFDFYRPVDARGHVRRMRHPGDYRNGDNVLCVPPRQRDRLHAFAEGS